MNSRVIVIVWKRIFLIQYEAFGRSQKLKTITFYCKINKDVKFYKPIVQT